MKSFSDKKENMQKIIYILTNEAMPGLVKIDKMETGIEQESPE